MMKKNIFITATIFFIFSISIFAQKGIIINSGAKMELSAGAILIIGEDLGLINNSANSIFDGTVVFSGTSLQEIGGSESTEFSVLDIDNNNGVFLSTDSRIADELILTTGVLDVGDFNLTLSDYSSVSGTFSSDNMINVAGAGLLSKEINSNDYFLLPVGDLTSGADYSPVEFNFTSGSYSNASVSLAVKNSKHPDNTSTTDYLNRYWILSSSGISDFSCDMTFTYVPGDVVGNETNIHGAIRNNNTWNDLGQVSSSQITGTSNSFADVTGVESQLFVGIGDVLNENLSVYYNNGVIFINNQNGIELKNVEVFDVSGRLLSEFSINNTGNEEISFSYLFTLFYKHGLCFRYFCSRKRADYYKEF